MKFNLIQYKSRKLLFNIAVKRDGISIGKNAFELMGSPLMISVYYDKDKQAIRLKREEMGEYKVNPKTHQLGVHRFSEVMPIGRYRYKKEDDVFILITNPSLLEYGGDKSPLSSIKEKEME